MKLTRESITFRGDRLPRPISALGLSKRQRSTSRGVIIPGRRVSVLQAADLIAVISGAHYVHGGECAGVGIVELFTRFETQDLMTRTHYPLPAEDQLPR